QKQRAAILLDDGLRGHVTNLDRKPQCARQQLVGAVERALSRVQQAEVVEHPQDRIVLLLLLERAERETEMRYGFIRSALCLRHDAEVLLNHARETSVAQAVREASRFAVAL